jgi:hypothetical protein
MQTQSSASAQSATELVAKASSDAANLVKAELALAREELGSDLAKVRRSAALLGLAALLAVGGVELVLGAIVVKARRHPLGLAATGAAFLGGAIALGASALTMAPKVLGRTRRRVAQDVAAIEEKIT